MDKRRARRIAHGTVGSLLSVNYDSDGDMWVGLEDLSDEDLDRVKAAIRDIMCYHWRLSEDD